MADLYLADAEIDGLLVSLTFSAQSMDEAERLTMERGWLLVGLFVSESPLDDLSDSYATLH